MLTSTSQLRFSFSRKRRGAFLLPPDSGLLRNAAPAWHWFTATCLGCSASTLHESNKVSDGLPSLASTLLLVSKMWFRTMFCGPATVPLRRLLTNSCGRASSGRLEEFLREVLPINVWQGDSIIWTITTVEE